MVDCMKRFFIKTFGCQMNKNDSEAIFNILVREDYKPTENIDEADIVIVNTCSVREHAEKRALGYISSLKRWRKKKGSVLAAVGCMARFREGELTSSRFPYVDMVLGPDSYRKLPEYLNLVLGKKTKIIDTAVGSELYTDICRKSKRVSDFVSISRGCNNYCSYCVVPYVRGRLRSRPVSDILSEVKALVAAGVKDITLLGQNVNEYSYKGTNFPELLRIVALNTNIFRLRFLTSHPKDFNDEIIDVVKENRNICEWFHLPLQAGNNRILRLMNRGYTKEDYLALIAKIRKNIPEAAITTDIIVGFPTETEEEFLETIDLVENIKFDDAYMYRYSPRPNTIAANYQSLPEECIKERLKRLIEIQNCIIKEKARRMIGKEYEVLFEEPLSAGSAEAMGGDIKIRKGTRGKTRGNKEVIVEDVIEPGSVHRVLITEIKGRTPIGKIGIS